MKTLAVRLENEQHTRVSILATVAGESLTDAIRDAINAQVAKLAADPDIRAKVDELTAEIDRDAAARRMALAALFGDTARQTRPPVVES